ncbi:MAG: NADH-quinone oxidoreductase subunit A [Candidatus Sumerlaeia bacterium]|nr:NADH-quinone oxidoreductase subunit A [Candidatus Sumerlaeia bacterium]
MEMFGEYGFFGALLLAGVFLGLGPVLVPLLIAPHSRGEKTEETYECGMETIGSAWIRFDLAFYLFALIFLAFSVAALYLFPVAVVYNSDAYIWRDLIAVTLFLLIMSSPLVYAWRMGVFGGGRGVVITQEDDTHEKAD